MGTRGPIGKRSDQLMGHGASKKRGDEVTSSGVTTDNLSWPAVDASWHIVASQWYEAIQAPATAQFYSQSDVAYAYAVAQLVSDQFSRSGGPVANALSAMFSAMNDLLTTEGARRRLRVELQKHDTGSGAELYDINAERRKLASS